MGGQAPLATVLAMTHGLHINWNAVGEPDSLSARWRIRALQRTALKGPFESFTARHDHVWRSEANLSSRKTFRSCTNWYATVFMAGVSCISILPQAPPHNPNTRTIPYCSLHAIAR